MAGEKVALGEKAGFGHGVRGAPQVGLGAVEWAALIPRRDRQQPAVAQAGEAVGAVALKPKRYLQTRPSLAARGVPGPTPQAWGVAMGME